MDSRRLSYLRALDIDVWRRRELSSNPPESSVGIPVAAGGQTESRQAPTVQANSQSRHSGAAAAVHGNPAVAAMDWDTLAETVRTCTACPLHKTRTNAVFGVGDRQARLMVIGEAPGADEDRKGEPFVGRAGQLLNSMLKAVGLSREQVFIANILKSRPPNNRDPQPAEVTACIPYLFRQIELVNPALILCVGRISAQTLLETGITIGKLRGKVHHLASGRPVVVTYHPAYLLRSPGEKRKAWADLVLAMQQLERFSGEPGRVQ